LTPDGPGYIKTSAEAEPRPLTEDEAQQAFTTLAAKGDEIAFRYVREGCECRAQLMIEHLEALGIDPGRAWALAVGRKLTVPDPSRPPRGTIQWENHVAPLVAVAGKPHGLLVLDPSLSQAGPLTVPEWTGAMRARAIEVSEVALSQAQILERQTAYTLQHGQPMDAVVFVLRRGVAPVPEKGGSGFRIAPDPPEGPSAFAHAEMRRLLDLQRQLRP
jgi:Glutaminase